MLTAVKIRKVYKDSLEVAVKYYSILNTLNNLSWTEMQINLIAFTAVRGNINSGGAKEIFIERFQSTKDSVQNTCTRLKKKGVLLKEGNKLLLHPSLIIAQTQGFLIQLNISEG